MLDNGGSEFSRDHIRSPMRASASRILCVFACVCVFCWRAFWAENNGFLAVLALAHADVHRGGWVRRCLLSRAHTRASALLKIVALTLAGCTIGPNYSPEPAPVPTHYKELKGWKRAQPSDEVARGDWWKVYKDRALDQLLPQIEVSNQTVAAAAAAYEQARAIVREAQAALFPVATAGYTVTRTRTGPLAIGGSTNVGTVSNPRGRGAIYSTTYTVPISATWDLDV